MITLNICAARIPGLTHAEYCRYLKDNHARLVAGTAAVVQHTHAYVQQHVFDASYGAAAPAARFDSVSQIVAARVEDYLAATATREYQEIIAPDEPRFSDNRVALFLMLEGTPLEVPIRGPSKLRLLHHLARNSHTPDSALLERWEAAHNSVLKEDPTVARSVRRAWLNRVLPGPDGESTYTGTCELGFIDKEDAPALCSYARQVEARLQGSIDPGKSFFLLAEMFPVYGAID